MNGIDYGVGFDNLKYKPVGTAISSTDTPTNTGSTDSSAETLFSFNRINTFENLQNFFIC
jgi:hypothetical protein